MARFDPPVPETSVTPNVVPLLDVMFLLMIFLMLGSDMSVRETADVALPTASAAKEPPADRKDRVVTLNVVHRGVACAEHAAGAACRAAEHWAYAIQGDEFDAASLGGHLLAAGQDALEPAEDGRRLSAVTLSIRCDKGAPFGRVQDALMACASAGIHRTEVAAALPTAQ